MNLYTCKVRLNGSVTNEVPKIGVTAPELVLLQHIHGADAVSNVEHHSQVQRDEEEERERLVSTYGTSAKGIQRVENVLGMSHQPLPTKVPGINLPEAKKPRGRPAKSTPMPETESAETQEDVLT